MTSTPCSTHSISPTPAVALSRLTLQNFRCFAHQELQIVKPQLLVIGPNGAGKTSLLEAIYYVCYAQSFKTKYSRQMIKQDSSGCSIRLNIETEREQHDILVGMTASKKILKIDGQAVSNHEKVAPLFSCATLTQEDMQLIAAGPERRRFFLNQNQFLGDASWLELARRYRNVLEQRNSLLSHKQVALDQLELWSQQLWQLSHKIQHWRQQFIIELNAICQRLLTEFIPELQGDITLVYKPAGNCHAMDFAEFATCILPNIVAKEKALCRTMFGAHLDDFQIILKSRCARSFASRGEQKLLTLLLKTAALCTHQRNGRPISCLLIDDFLTDLDPLRIAKCQAIIDHLRTQTIITLPILQRDLFPPHVQYQEVLL